MWSEGTIGIPKGNGGYKSVKYWLKSFEEPSEDYGINGGMISKRALRWTVSGSPTTIEAGILSRPAKRRNLLFASC